MDSVVPVHAHELLVLHDDPDHEAVRRFLVPGLVEHRMAEGVEDGFAVVELDALYRVRPVTKDQIGARIERLFSERPDLVDALDDIVRAATRLTAA